MTCGGTWDTAQWFNDGNSTSGNVGNYDGFGVGYTGTSGTYSSYVMRASGMLTNDLSGSELRTISTNNRSDGDGSLGFGFRLQDSIVYLSGAYSYIGKEWSGSCTYDSNFGSYSGIATGYYVHTWETAVLSSVTFGVNNQTAGVNFTIIDEAYFFQAFGSDKVF
ncbi:hypothetical protein SDC9_51880 [bioreactor metagenome]|uniref:Uncharacterized protein n=1 Tax=bioreactor metagenome TaxID=1076179 RepID=A0A644WP57_9ZZZZ